MPRSTAVPISERPDLSAEMRPSRRTWRVRGLMAAVVVAALGLGLGIPAYRIAGDWDYHVHTSWIVSPDGRSWFIRPVFERSPFWPRYARYLAGRPWKGRPFCRPDPRLKLDDCELAHPEMVERSPDGLTVQILMAPAQRAEYEQAKARNPGTIAYGLNRKPIP